MNQNRDEVPNQQEGIDRSKTLEGAGTNEAHDGGNRQNPDHPDPNNLSPGQLATLIGTLTQLQKNNPPREQEGNSHQPHRQEVSTLGSSQITIHPRHEKDHHRPETWHLNKEMKAELSRKRLAYEEEKARTYEKFSQKPGKEHISGANQQSHNPPEIDPTTLQLMVAVKDMQRKLEGRSEAPSHESPFTTRLEGEERQTGLKMPTLNAYDGLNDPEEHTNYFDQLALFFDYKDLTCCRFFASTFKGCAQRWFGKLRPRTIDSWADFKGVFLQQFKINQAYHVHTMYLETIKQVDGEELESYVNRFRIAASKITNLNEIEVVGIFRRGLNPFEQEKYACELLTSNATTLSQVYSLAVRHIAQAEALKAMKLARGKWPTSYPSAQPGSRDKRSRVDSPYVHEAQRNSPNQTKRAENQRPPPSRYQSTRRPIPEWTQFTMSRTNILREIKGKPYYRPPPPMKGPLSTRLKDRFCAYHEDHGHDTESCVALKYFLEYLKEKGLLNQYLPRKVVVEITSPKDTSKNVVNIVIGGTAPPSSIPDGNPSVVHTISDECSEDFPITFTSADYEDLHPCHHEALVVTLDVAGNDVKRILIDNGSAVDICYLHTLKRMDLKGQTMDDYVRDPLYGFGHNAVPVVGTIFMPVLFGTPPTHKEAMIHFHVINAPSSYNMLLGRPALAKLRAITSTPHLKMKFPTPAGIGEVKGDTSMARQCYSTAMALAQTDPSNSRRAKDQLRKREKRKRHFEAQTKQKKRKEVQNIERVIDAGEDGGGIDATLRFCIQREQNPLTSPGVDTEKVILDVACHDRYVQIGANIDASLKTELICLLREYKSIFAWSPSDMPGVSEATTLHHLKVDPHRKPIRQKKRNFAPDRQVAIDVEISKLLDADLICEVQYPEWIANVVLVKKSNSKWRICVDYTDLNTACPKDSYPLPSIDQLIDATAGHQMLSFMDAFSGYNQIKMAPKDREKTSFITHRGTYCYKVMSFGLINAGATFQRAMNKIFTNQIGRNMEVYVDDLISKSKSTDNHVGDLKECFHTIRSHNLKLNPDKCTFGLTSGKFLGYLVSHRGIEANPKKINAILTMQPPRTQKEIQVLTGRLAALRRFIAKLADRSLPFFETLRGASKRKCVDWNDECQMAFDALKTYLSTPPVLAVAKPEEPLLLYLSAGPKAVGAVLVKDEGGHTVQKTIVFIPFTVLSKQVMLDPIVVTMQRYNPNFPNPLL